MKYLLVIRTIALLYSTLFIESSFSLSTSTPAHVAKDTEFEQCQSRGNCNIEAKCHFEILDKKNNRTITGNIFTISNGMPYNITFYWDLFYDSPQLRPEGLNQNRSAPFDMDDVLYGTVIAAPNSINYFDSGSEEVQAIRLYIPVESNPFGFDVKRSDLRYKVNSTYYGNIYRSVEKGVFFHSHSEHIQSLTLSVNYRKESKCTKNQACRWLMNVCYAAPTYKKERCLEYEKSCGNFDLDLDPREENDKLARDTCLNDCAAEYYGLNLNLDSEVAMAWFRRGGAAKGGNMDGYFNVQWSMILHTLFVLLIVSNITMFHYAAWFKRRLKERSGYHQAKEEEENTTKNNSQTEFESIESTSKSTTSGSNSDSESSGTITILD